MDAHPGNAENSSGGKSKVLTGDLTDLEVIGYPRSFLANSVSSPRKEVTITTTTTNQKP